MFRFLTLSYHRNFFYLCEKCPASVCLRRQTETKQARRSRSSPPPRLRSLSRTSVFLSDKHRLSNYSSASSFALSLYCIFWLPGFNKPLYLFVTTQAALALVAALFNFLTGYLLEEGWGRTNGAARPVAAVSAAFFMTVCTQLQKRFILGNSLLIWLWSRLICASSWRFSPRTRFASKYYLHISHKFTWKPDKFKITCANTH